MQFILVAAAVAALLTGLGGGALGLLELRSGAGSALLQTAALMLLGGFILLGMGAIVQRLRHLADVLETRPVPLNFAAPAAAVPAPRPPSAESVPPRAVRQRARAPEPEHEDAATIAAPQAPAGAVAVPVALPDHPSSEQKAAPVIAAPAMPAAPPTEAIAWPTLTASDRIVPPATPEAAEPQEPALRPEPRAEPEAASGEQSGPAAAPDVVLKTGVIEGMTYTIYADGSVDAELPEGTVRFASVAAWRDHVRPPG